MLSVLSQNQRLIRKHRIVKRLLAEIGRAPETANVAILVPQRKREHARQMGDAVSAPFLPGMDDDFGIRLRDEAMALELKLVATDFKIVDFAIEDDANRTVGAEHRLIAGDKINDSQPPVAKANAGRKVETVAIRAAMRDGIGHSLDEGTIRAGVLPSCQTIPQFRTRLSLQSLSGLTPVGVRRRWRR